MLANSFLCIQWHSSIRLHPLIMRGVFLLITAYFGRHVACESSCYHQSFYFHTFHLDHCKTGQSIDYENSPLEEKSVQLIVSGQKEESKEVAICFRAILALGVPSCFFDVAGIQFFYSNPLGPPLGSRHGYGHLRLKSSNDRKIIFQPGSNFMVGERLKVCLWIRITDLKSQIKMFWNGQKILDETHQGSDAIKEPLVLNSGNYLGACNVTGASKAQPLEKYNMEGSMINFQLWTHRVSDETMLAYTRGNLTELELSSLENKSIVSSERFEKVGSHVRPYQTDDCSTKSKTNPLYVRRLSNYDEHLALCQSIFGGSLFLPNNPEDLKILMRHIKNTSLYLETVVGNDTCDMFWLPLTKTCQKDKPCIWKDSKLKKVQFLPFTTGEPQNGISQKCATVKVKDNLSDAAYYSQDCDRYLACAVCIIPQLRKFTLRGFEDLGIDYNYYLRTFRPDPSGKVLHYTGSTGTVIEYNSDTQLFQVIKGCKDGGKHVVIEAHTSKPYGTLRNVTVRKENGESFLTSLKFTHVSHSLMPTYRIGT